MRRFIQRSASPNWRYFFIIFVNQHFWPGSSQERIHTGLVYNVSRKSVRYFRITQVPKGSLCSSRFLSFSRRRSNKRAKEHAWGENWGEVLAREGVERETGGGGEKRNRLHSIPNILPNSVRPGTGSISAIWLVISPLIKIWHQNFVFHA